ncbi:YphA family membrane protein [Bacillus chungangensis]|uniref:Uncharacterized protein n=1 Tax=Bacillus chungangensis TaxID=587633 RepID=A0ABT9WSD4_9BACI|nr:hypothetical protein [Bacillus chungangensis]MDQ0176213.1 hypothetical protein [Bacillus chungangensis]
MAGTIFLWCMWAVWIIATFLLPKQTQPRLFLAIFSLLLIIFVPFTFSILFLKIQLTAVVLLLLAYLAISRFDIRKRLYNFISICIVSLGYTGFLLFEIIDPVWLMLDRRILICAYMFLLIWLLENKDIFSQLSMMTAGMIHGEILFAMILSKWGMPYLAGSPEFLDTLMISSFPFLSFYFFRRLPRIILQKITLNNMKGMRH